MAQQPPARSQSEHEVRTQRIVPGRACFLSVSTFRGTCRVFSPNAVPSGAFYSLPVDHSAKFPWLVENEVEQELLSHSCLNVFDGGLQRESMRAPFFPQHGRGHLRARATFVRCRTSVEPGEGGRISVVSTELHLAARSNRIANTKSL